MNNTVIKFYGPNDIEIWAKETLSAEELAQFQQALSNNNTHFDTQRDNGKFVVEYVYETYRSTLLDTHIDILVGEKFIFAEGSSLETDCAALPEFFIWLERYYRETGGDNLLYI